MASGPVGKDYTTGELARAIYTNPTWDQNCRPREDGEPAPPIKSWMLSRVRKAAAAFADPVGRVGHGHAILWRAFDRINFGGMSAARRPSATRPAALLAPRAPVGQVTDLYSETTVISLDALADRLCRKPL